MSGSSEKPLPVTLWSERENQEHDELLKSDEAMQAELTLEEKKEKLQAERTVALTDMMRLVRKLEPELELKEKLLLTAPEPDLRLKERLLLLTVPEPELKLKEKLLLIETEPQLTFKDKLLLTETEPQLTFKEKNLLQKLEPTLDENALQVVLETEPELTLDENALQVEPVTETDTETETESEIETEPELTAEEMLEVLLPDPELTMEEKVLQGLHLTCCQEFTEYDPRKNAFVCTRFCSFNIAFFDLDEESKAIHGPPLQELSDSQWRSIVQSSVNVISLKVLESDEGYPINVFGTVIARDEVDYKCVYLFKRGRNDPQHICSAKDMLTLTDPCRGFALSARMFFEINLKIKGDDITKDRDFSKGVIEHCCIPFAKRPVTELLSSWLSTVELVYTPVPYPVAATIKVNVLGGPRGVPFNGKITAWTTGNEKNYMILYEYDDSKTASARALIDDGGSVVLTRKLVAVPVPMSTFDDGVEEIVINVCFIASNDEDERTPVTLEYPQKEKKCRHGSYELQVKVDWTAIFTRRTSKEIYRRWRSVPRKLFRLGPQNYVPLG